MAQVLFSTNIEIEKAAQILKKGNLVAFPTETVYGLGAIYDHEEAIQKIFQVKGRPSDNPLIVHISSLQQVSLLTDYIPSDFYRLVSSFFPGPLTIVLPKKKELSSLVTGGKESVAFRMPSHPLALKLIARVGKPLVAPSANLSGKPSSTRLLHVLEDFKEKISAVIDGGDCQIGVESTVLSLCQDPPVLLRPGHISKEDLERVLGKSVHLPTENDLRQAASPGMKYRHYAPIAPVFLFSSQNEIDSYRASAPAKKRHCFIPSCQNLYEELRLADRKDVEEILILCHPLIRENEGLMNRILRCSEKK